jgi:hypothetical protein
VAFGFIPCFLFETYRCTSPSVPLSLFVLNSPFLFHGGHPRAEKASKDRRPITWNTHGQTVVQRDTTFPKAEGDTTFCP